MGLNGNSQEDKILSISRETEAKSHHFEEASTAALSPMAITATRAQDSPWSCPS
jgi:hypothetical protein